MDESNPWSAVPADRTWKYAYCERERRFLLTLLPELPIAKPALQLRDKYLHGSYFRLRKASGIQGIEYKLQKKLRLEERRTDELWNSTIYISEAEYKLFLPLPGIILEKERHFFTGPSGETICVDEFLLPQRRLLIAEVEFKTLEAMSAYEFPVAFVQELSNQAGWSSFDLAREMNGIA